MIAAHQHSFRVAKLEILARTTDAPLGDASGFFCEFGGQTFLVTNWHVVAGRHFQTNRPIHRSQALPGCLQVHTHISSNREQSSAPSSSTSFRIELYDDEQETWLEHPLFGRSVDVVAIPMNPRIRDIGQIYRINLETELSKQTELAVMDQTFVTGYPLSATTTPNSLPIYKSGTIASEPAIFDSEPRIYIDGKTKSGMSGSPVMVRGKRISPTVDEPGSNENDLNSLAFVGIYSGRDRQERTEFEAELGIMWPFKECLIPILDTYVNAADLVRPSGASAG